MKKIPLSLLLFTLILFFSVNLSAEIVKILILGDTQKIMNPKNGKQHNFVPFMAKLLTDPITKDADFILQMGDIVESDQDNSDRPQQYFVAQQGWRQLDGKIPYVLNIGNNDNFEEYLEAFSYLPDPFWSSAEGKNFAYNFKAGGISWLVISLRHESSDDEDQLVVGLIESHSDMRVILIKHDINFGNELVNQLKKYPNVVFILSGHTQSGKALLTSNNGNTIGWIRTCHHSEYRDSYLRMLLVDTVEGTVSSSFYSPQYEKFWHDPTAPFNDPKKGAPWVWHGFNFGSESSDGSNDAEFVSLQMPFKVTPGQQFEAKVTYRNIGTNTWLANSQYKLGSYNLRDNRDWGVGTNRTLLSRSVSPGEKYTFTINCTAPAIEGSYNFQRRMLQEKVQWFGDVSENRIVEVTYNVVMNASFENRAKHWEMSAGASVVPENRQSGNFSLKLKNENENEVDVIAASQTISVVPHTNYNISVWINNKKVTSGEVTFDIKRSLDDKSEMQIVADPEAVNEWEQYEREFNSGDLTLLTIHISGSNLEGVAFIDNIVVTPLRNTAPVVESFPDQVVYENTFFNYSLEATDADEDMLTYRALDIPKWLTFNSELGILSGTSPSYKGANIYPVTLCVSDGKREVKHFFYITVVGSRPYDEWSHFNNLSGFSEDPDKDGFLNLLEFALGGDPGKNNTPNELILHSLSESSFDFTFRRNQRTVNYTIQESMDLKNWNDYLVVDDSYGLVGDVCTISLPVSGDRQFFKLQVSR